MPAGPTVASRIGHDNGRVFQAARVPANTGRSARASTTDIAFTTTLTTADHPRTPLARSIWYDRRLPVRLPWQLRDDEGALPTADRNSIRPTGLRTELRARTRECFACQQSRRSPTRSTCLTPGREQHPGTAPHPSEPEGLSALHASSRFGNGYGHDLHKHGDGLRGAHNSGSAPAPSHAT